MTASEPAPMRRVRPWIAALLTFIGWGLGFFYAGRTRLAIIMAFTPIALGFVLALGIWALLLNVEQIPHVLGRFEPWMLDLAKLGLTGIIAGFAWAAARRERQVPRASPVRLLGYLAIWLAPLLLLLAPMSVRFFYVQPFRIPAGNMEPTLHVGDFVVVSKSAYGYGPYSTAPLIGLIQRDPDETRVPERGDVVVFRPASEPNRDFIKRVVGVPGDRIQMIGGVLHINGAAVRMQDLGELNAPDGATSEPVRAYRETLPNGVSYTVLDMRDGELDNTRAYVVPPNHYFMMGDHRDDSADSRVAFVGFVPIENIVGRVDHIVRGPGAQEAEY